MSKVWSGQRKFEIWLEIEGLACEAMAELCQIPKEDAAEIRKRARFSIPKILEIEKRTNHDVIAFLENVAESVGPAYAPSNVITGQAYECAGSKFAM